MKDIELYGESSINKPLEFFKVFLTSDGFYFYYEGLLSEKDNIIEKYGSSVSIPSIEYELNIKFQGESDKSIDFIEEKIASFHFDKSKIESYLIHIVNDFVYIITNNNSISKLSDYPMFRKILYQFIDHLFKRYNAFISPKDFPIYEEAKLFLQTNIHTFKDQNRNDTVQLKDPPNSKKIIEIRGFKWISDPNRNTYHLYDFLVANKVIASENTANIFEIAFSGEKIEKPLKIRWLYRTKRGDTKPVIIKVIKLLMDEMTVIEKIPVQAHLAKTIEVIFVDSDGKPITGTQTTLSDMKKSKGIIQDMTLEDLLKKLRKVQFNINISTKQ